MAEPVDDRLHSLTGLEVGEDERPVGALAAGVALHHAQIGAHACLTTPSATRVYRTASATRTRCTAGSLAPGAVVEWVPDHVIPSAGAALRQSLEVEAGAGATLIAVDAFAAGRVACGEAWRFALLDSALTVRDAAGLVLHDRFVLRGGERWGGLGFAEARPYFATVVVVAPAGLDDLVAGLPDALGAADGFTAAAARLPRRGVVIRVLAAGAPALTDGLGAIWRFARQRVLGLPPLALRKL